ncbi:MAG: hypothetical protein ACE5DO_11480 [Desulfobacterales bacterium]
MSKLWEDLKKNMKDWSSAAVEKAEEVSKIAVAKTEELTRISKIKLEIHQLQRDQSKLYEKIGKKVIEHFADNDTLKADDIDSLKSSADEINRLTQAIHEKELKIQTIKEESGIEEDEASIETDVSTVEEKDEEKKTEED